MGNSTDKVNTQKNTVKMVLQLVLIIGLILLVVRINHLREFPYKIMQYDESRGVTVTIYNLQNKGKEPIQLTTGEFFRNLDVQTEPADILALPLKGKKVELKLLDFESRYCMVFHENCSI